jgi:hypothetical protein
MFSFSCPKSNEEPLMRRCRKDSHDILPGRESDHLFLDTLMSFRDVYRRSTSRVDRQDIMREGNEDEEPV